VAISNNRLLDIAEDKVTFRYKDYRQDAQQKTMTLEAEEFIRRFLLHVLPQGFQRIRYYGFLANRYRVEKLAHCRELLDMPAPEPPDFEAANDYPERYEERLFVAGLPNLSPRPHAGDPDLAAKPTQAGGDHGYLMIKWTVFGRRSNCGGQVWPGQAPGAVLPHGSLGTFSKRRILSADAVLVHWRPNQLSPQSRTLTVSDHFRSSPEIQPTNNTHKPRSGRRFRPIDF